MNLDAYSEKPQSTAAVKDDKMSDFKTFINLFKCFIGIGIIATPAAIAKVGIVGGSLAIIACGLLNIYTMKMQVKCMQRAGSTVTSYSELSQKIFGTNGKIITDICLVIS